MQTRGPGGPAACWRYVAQLRGSEQSFQQSPLGSQNSWALQCGICTGSGRITGSAAAGKTSTFLNESKFKSDSTHVVGNTGERIGQCWLEAVVAILE